MGSDAPPFLPSVTLCTMRNSRLERTPYVSNSKKILTLAHLRVFLSDFWSTTYRQTRLTTLNKRSTIKNGRGQCKSGRGFKIFARLLLTNPPVYNPGSAPVKVLKVYNPTYKIYRLYHCTSVAYLLLYYGYSKDQRHRL